MALVYFFVYVYHGATPALFRWTLLNFTQVFSEAAIRRALFPPAATSSSWLADLCWNNRSPPARRRIHALAWVPSWFLGALTLQYFFSLNVTTGDAFMDRCCCCVLCCWDFG